MNMNINFKIVFILIFIIFIIFINQNNGYIIKNIKLLDDYNSLYSDNGQSCIFTSQILCVAENLNENCTQLTFTNNPISISLGINNDTAQEYTLKFEVPIGGFSTTINSIYTINYYCYELDLDPIKFKRINNIQYLTSNSNFGYYFLAMYEILGINSQNNIPLSNIKGECVEIKCSFGSYRAYNSFLLQVDEALPPNFNFTSTQVKITIGSKSKLFDLNIFDIDIYDSIYDVKTYPDSKYLKDLKLMGYGESALISFTSNLTVSKSPFLIKGISENSNYQFIPIYGNEKSTTFLYSIKDFNDQEYSLYYKSGSIFKKLNTTITTNITQYTISFPDSYKINQYSLNNLPLCAIQFSEVKRYEFTPLNIQIGNADKVSTSYPLGYTYGDKDGYQFDFTVISLEIAYFSPYISITQYSKDIPLQIGISQTGSYDVSKLPTIYSYESKFLTGDIYLIKFKVKSPYGFSRISSQSTEAYGYEVFVGGDQYDSEIEISTSTSLDSILYFYDIYNGFTLFSSGAILSLSPNLMQYLTPSFIHEFDILKIKNLSFLYNDIDVTNHRHFNSMYFSYSGVSRDQVFTIMVVDVGYIPLNSLDYKLQRFNSVYDDKLQLFRIDFFVEANSQVGDFNFIVINGYAPYCSSFLDNQLRIKKSNMDFQGPVFKEIKKINDGIKISGLGNQTYEIGWSMLIQDLYNGFDFGYVLIKGELDQSIYNISINSKDNVKSGGNMFLGEYDFKIQLSYPCVSQQYIISQVSLFDSVKRESSFSIFPSDPELSSAGNPFMYYLNDTNINKIQVECSLDPVASIDKTPPVLKSFAVSRTTVDVASLDRTVIFIFTAEDLESGIKDHQYPIVYLTSGGASYIECKSTILQITMTNATYSCTIELPIGFGYGYLNTIILSIYNFINNNAIFSGYSTKHLMDLGMPNSIATTFNSNQPLLYRHETITEKGGDLFIIGRKLSNGSLAFITFNDSSKLQIQSVYISSTVIKLSNVKATRYPYQVYLVSSSIVTNTITINPTLYDYYIHSEPEPTFPPTVTPVPTNAPQLCKGNPLCGGPSNGKCTSTGCICYSPWFGIDCLSQIVIIDPPIINTGNNSNGSGDNNGSPTIEIIVPDRNNNTSNNNSSSGGGSDTKVVTYSSLISIVSLREINIMGIAENTFTFQDNWLSQQIDESTFTFFNDIKHLNTTTDIKVTLKWFKNQTSITFAQEQLVMNPSSIKYTIEISNYQFKSPLNQLQLVMSALIQSNTTQNVCSAKEFGETSNGDNSNYIKIQIENYSLYGRFIRRGIVDSEIRTVSNQLLDKDMKPITSTKSLQTFVGILVPYYTDSVIIDPDFSILVDSNSASSKSNSICSSKGLSTSKIIGIIIGGVAFLSIIIISITYHLIKKRKDQKFMNNVDRKMKQINNKTINNDDL